MRRQEQKEEMIFGKEESWGRGVGGTRDECERRLLLEIESVSLWKRKEYID
jgi:hypothetical protein